jgi:hypothetical protein
VSVDANSARAAHDGRRVRHRSAPWRADSAPSARRQWLHRRNVEDVLCELCQGFSPRRVALTDAIVADEVTHVPARVHPFVAIAGDCRDTDVPVPQPDLRNRRVGLIADVVCEVAAILAAVPKREPVVSVTARFAGVVVVEGFGGQGDAGDAVRGAGGVDADVDAGLFDVFNLDVVEGDNNLGAGRAGFICNGRRPATTAAPRAAWSGRSGCCVTYDVEILTGGHGSYHRAPQGFDRVYH